MTDNRRSQVSRMLLREMKDVTFDNWKNAAWDTTLYWPLVNLPDFARDLAALDKTDSALAAKARPYLEHLTKWERDGGCV
jgi:hypothetical protein